jgi:hypothetical protein
MTDDFERRLAAAQARGVKMGERDSAKLAAEQAAEEERDRVERATVEQWERRIVPLIQNVVDKANKGIAGSGKRLVVVQRQHDAMTPYAAIYDAPENQPGFTERTPADRHLRISVERRGTIIIAIGPSTDKAETRLSPESLGQKEIEGAVIRFVEKILPP